MIPRIGDCIVSDESPFGEPIFEYSRRQAIEDGLLIDVTAMAKEAGIRLPAVVTAGLWHQWVVPDEDSVAAGQCRREAVGCAFSLSIRGGEEPKVRSSCLPGGLHSQRVPADRRGDQSNRWSGRSRGARDYVPACR